MGAVQTLAAKQPAHLAGLRAALCLLQNPQSILRGLAPLRLGHDLRVRRWPRVAGSAPGGLVATLLDPQGRSVHLLQCHRFSFCGHWYSPPPPYSNSKGGRCLSDVGREGGEADVAAIDCVTHALLERYRPSSLNGTRKLGRTHRAPGIPYVTRCTEDRNLIARMRTAIVNTFGDPKFATVRDALLLKDIEQTTVSDYEPIKEYQENAARFGYPQLA